MKPVDPGTVDESMIAEDNVSAEVPDWRRERASRLWDPPARLLKSIRDYQRYRSGLAWHHKLWRSISVIRYRFWSIVCACDIPLNSQLGGGLLLTHPNGVVIHPSAEIGVNCLILQQVTLVAGVKLQGHVDIGAGAKIIRPVTIGRHAKVGANSVVLNDVPDGAIAVGVPARIIPNSEMCPEVCQVAHIASS